MVESPIDPSIAAIKIESFQSDAIIDAYKKIGIDVSGYFDGIDSVGLYECQKTKYRFFYPHSISGVASLYEHLQQRKGYYRLKNEHEEALRFINRGDSVLEIGCGEGLFIQALRSQHINGQGLEFNELAVEKARGAGLRVLKEDISAFAWKNKEAFDVVCFFQVLEHIPHVNKFLEAAIYALKKGGVLIIGVPNNNPFLFKNDKWHALNLPPHHMGLWDSESLAKLATCYPLKIVEIKVEHLRPEDLRYYAEINSDVFRLKNGLTWLFLRIWPGFLRRFLHGMVARRISGRNVIAVYQKVEAIGQVSAK